KIIDWLSPANFFLQQETIFGRRQVGTGEWLLVDDRFKRWKTGSGGILWGRGAPGAGKTVLASIVVDHLVESHTDDNIGVACIYLNHKETHEQTTSNLLASIWGQLVLGKPIASTSLVHKLFQKHSKKRTKPEPAQIHEVVRLAITEWSRVYIVVDALDETPEDNWQYLLNYLTDMGPDVYLMLTSRYDVSLPNITAEMFDIRVPEEDIQKYVEHQINVRLSVTTSSQLCKEIIAKILENAGGMFLLAKLHIESLAACTTIATIRGRLKKLSSNLELAYSQAMERIDIQTEERKKLAYSTLAWVTKAMRPLEVTELQEALAVKWGAKRLNPERRPEMKIILSVCVGLVIVDEVDEESSVVRLVHATTQEYFNSQFPGAHTDITRTLLTYMMFNEVQVILGKNIWELEEIEEKYPLIDYCEHCLVHAQNVRQPERELWELIMDVLEQAVAWCPIWEYLGQCPWNYPSWPKSPSPLWVAAAANLQEIMQYLLNGGIPPDSGQTQDDSPLCAASFYGHLHIAKLLLKTGVNVNADGGPTGSALGAASSRGHIDIIHLLFENGANVHMGNDSALRAASESGHTKVVQGLPHPVQDVVGSQGWYGACKGLTRRGRRALRKGLTVKGANANVTNENGESLLITMSAKKYIQSEQRVDVVRLLLENGAEVNAGNNGALQAASKADSTEIVQLLLEHGANINAPGKDNVGALEAAASRNGSPHEMDLLWDSEDQKKKKIAEATTRWLTHIRFLLDNGADVHARNNGALRVASKAGNTEVVELLLKHGADVNAADEHTGSALEAAASWDGNPSVDPWDSEKVKRRKMAEVAMRRLMHVRLLLDNGADVHGGNHGALREAAKRGHTEVIQLLLENGCNINAVDEHTGSAVEAAASWDGNPSINSRDSKKGKRKKMAEAAARRLTHVRFLLDNSADVHARNNGALRVASKAGNTEVVQLLLEHGADVNAADEQSGSALEAAASWDGSPDPMHPRASEDEKRRKMAEVATRRLMQVRLLLDNGADVHGRNHGALREAAKRGHTEVVQLLLENGADVNAADEHTGSALEAAASWDGNPDPMHAGTSDNKRRRKMAEAATRRLQLVRLLLNKGADVHARNGTLRAAAKAGNTEVVQLLLENGASVNAVDEHTGSALEAAASWDGNPSINSQDSKKRKRRKMAEAAARRLTHVRFLLDKGADIHARNNGALRVASERGYIWVVQLLLSKGADVQAGNNGALRAASKRGYTEVVQLLLENGANANAANEHTGSALEAAASWDGNSTKIYDWDSEDKKRSEMAEARLTHVRFLLDNGADVHARNNGALRAAHKAGNTEVEQLFLDHGAEALENAETESQHAEPESQVETDSSEISHSSLAHFFSLP
ncbi:ankyrin repeat-containing domain protein, partial [Mycena rebaudengoi]